MNLRQLECFLAAANSRSMTRAADSLRLSQSAVSLAVGALEASLGTSLFVRHRGRGLTLTPAGQALLMPVRDLVAHADEVREQAQSLSSELVGGLTIGVYRTAAPFMLPMLLETFGSAYPGVALDFIEGDTEALSHALLEGTCELAIMYDIGLSAELQCEKLYDAIPYVLLAPGHPMAACEHITLGDLAPLDMILLDIPPSREHQLGLFAHAGVEPVVRYRIGSHELLRAMVARDLGYSLLISRPHGDVSYEGKPLVTRPLMGDVPPVDMIIARPRGVRSTRRARAFNEHCHRVLPALTVPGGALGPLATKT